MDGIRYEGNYLERFSPSHLNRYTELGSDEDAANWLLMQCVVATANIEIHESVLGIPGFHWINEDAHPYWKTHQYVVATPNTEIHESDLAIPDFHWINENNCPYWKIQRYGLKASKLLGRLVRNKDIDIKSNPLWKLLSRTYQSCFVEEMEFGRINKILYPFYDLINEAVLRDNVIVTLGVTFTPGDASEGVDDYGNPAWYTKWTAEKDGVKRYCHSCCEDTVRWVIDTARNFNNISYIDKEEGYFDDN